MMVWTALLLGCASCYLIKLAGLSAPRSLLADDRVEEIVALLPVALLAALVAVQTFSDGQQLTVDARAAGLAVAIAAVLARAPFLLVVGLAAGTAALLRWLI